jgi:hypothetical protein
MTRDELQRGLRQATGFSQRQELLKQLWRLCEQQAAAAGQEAGSTELAGSGVLTRKETHDERHRIPQRT